MNLLRYLLTNNMPVYLGQCDVFTRHTGTQYFSSSYPPQNLPLYATLCRRGVGDKYLYQYGTTADWLDCKFDARCAVYSPGGL